VVAILFAGVFYGKAGSKIKVAWNCKPTSYSTRLSGNQKIEGSLPTRALSLEKPFAAATQQYQEAQKSAQNFLWRKLKTSSSCDQCTMRLPNLIRKLLLLPTPPARDSSNCCSSLNRLQRLTAELDLRLGLYKCSRTSDAALKTWTNLKQRLGSKPSVIA